MLVPKNLHLFCRVVDNFGDVGVCWRLARQLVSEHGFRVTLWLDHWPSLQRMHRALDLGRDSQLAAGVTVRRWPSATATFGVDEVGEIVIEAFACDLPPGYVAAMAQCHVKPVWLNLEYLSAEAWVEGCHALPSPHPSLPLTKYFFFPGFTSKTGGLLREGDLLARRDAFVNAPGSGVNFLNRLGVNVPEGACKVSLFCYPTAPGSALFEAMQAGTQPVFCLVPEGVATEAVAAFLQQPAMPGARATRGSLTLQVLPFLEQEDYDSLLWSCDLNFVRGEDSLVRAQWAGKPFIWHIYPQAENAHVPKLDAFLGGYTEHLAPAAALDVTRFYLAWNGIREQDALGTLWPALCSRKPVLTAYGADWVRQLSQSGDLVSNLLRFVAKIC